jgi:hypothetical protein
MKVSDAELRRMKKWEPDQPFADLLALRLVVPLPAGTFEGAATIRQKPRNGLGQNAATMLPRLRIRMVFDKTAPRAVIAFDDGAAWLRSVSAMPSGMELDLMRQACWRMSNRVTRGSRERTQLAKRALVCYRQKWPDDSRLQRQPGSFLAEPVAA